MIDERTAKEFLEHRHLAVVGASADPRSFGNTVYKALRDAGCDPVPVNPGTETVEGDRCYRDLAAVPGVIRGVVVMVGQDRSADVVRACIDRGVPRVWLFQGLGGRGAVSEEAVELCQRHGIEVIAGACPLMFLEPVGWFHRVHRALRRSNGSLSGRPVPVTVTR